MGSTDVSERVEAVRRFNRFYTRKIGVLQEKLLLSPFSLTEARLIYELAHSAGSTATELRGRLGLDAGYLSRILRKLRKSGLISSQASKTDGRRSHLRMTEQGLAAFSRLNAASQEEIAAMLAALAEEEQKRLIAAMRTVEHLIDGRPAPRVPYVIRPPQPGDMGWVVYRHGLLYNQEYGWDEQFETLVADIVTRFARNHDPRRERCWIAELEGENIGSVFLVRQSDEVAKLRLLLVEPRGRGLGIGSRLVGECVRFARQAGYRKMVLWTNSVLLAARRIYEKTGFRLVHEEQHRSFGHDLTGETWELDLTGGPSGALPAAAADPAAAAGTASPPS